MYSWSGGSGWKVKFAFAWPTSAKVKNKIKMTILLYEYANTLGVITFVSISPIEGAALTVENATSKTSANNHFAFLCGNTPPFPPPSRYANFKKGFSTHYLLFK